LKGRLAGFLAAGKGAGKGIAQTTLPTSDIEAFFLLRTKASD